MLDEGVYLCSIRKMYRILADDQTVARTNGGNTRSPAGYVDGIEGSTVWVRLEEAVTRAGS